MSKKNVEALLGDLRGNTSTRFSKGDFQALVFSIMADPDFKAKRFLVRGGNIVESDVCINKDMCKFLDKLLKHAGVSDATERAGIIDSFEYGVRDIEWVTDAVDEAMHQYTEVGKNMRMFRDKMHQLSVCKMARTGKYEGKITYRKTVKSLADKKPKA